MSSTLNAILGMTVLLAVMGYGVFALYTGMREGSFPYFGKRIAKAANAFGFWTAMAATIVAMFLAARTIPLFLVMLS